MIRCYLGAGLLAALLILCLGSTRLFLNRQAQVLTLAEQALAAAEAGDGALAREKEAQARQHWQRHHRISAVLTDHGALAPVDAAFQQLGNSRDPQDYRRLCLALETLLREHRICPENIF